MRICKISEVLGRVGEQISGVSGKLKSVFKAKTGEGQYGKWSLQDAVLVDPMTSEEMTITFANFDDMSRLRNQLVTITAKQGDKGLSGLIVKESEYNGKKYIKLHITGSAMIDSGVTHEFDGGVNDIGTPADAQGVDPEEQAALALLAKKKAEKERAAQLEADARIRAAGVSACNSVKSLTKRDVQIVNLFRKALKGAVWACDKENVPFYTESVATLFIAMRDDNLTDSMPVEFREESPKITATGLDRVLSEAFPNTAIQADPVPEVDQEPKTWQEVQVHLEGPYKGFPLGVMKPELIEELFNTFKPKMNPKTNNYEMHDLYLKNALLSWKKEQDV